MTQRDELNDYTHRGARALVLLHEAEMRSLLSTWRQAKAAGFALPKGDNPTYESLETILRHVLRAARGYMVWMCEVLDLPDPEIRATPRADGIEAQADDYLDHVLERWRLPLRDLTEKAADRTHALSRWGVPYCVDAMLEHAVMHPLRHRFQIEEWLGADR